MLPRYIQCVKRFKNIALNEENREIVGFFEKNLLRCDVFS